MSTVLQAREQIERPAQLPLPRWLGRMAHAPRESLKPCVAEALPLLGFAQFLQVLVFPRESARLAFGTVPDAWSVRYRALARACDDPCVARARRDRLPALVLASDAPVAAWHEVARLLDIAGWLTVSFHGCAGELVVSEFGLGDEGLARAATGWLGSCAAEALLLAHLVYQRAGADAACDGEHGAVASDREIDCLALASLGHKCEDIAERLHISVHTVRFHLRNVRARLKARTLSSALACAMQDPRLGARIARQRMALSSGTFSRSVLHEVTGGFHGHD
jgi:DNA-binding CsgD family transcriptional regulator